MRQPVETLWDGQVVGRQFTNQAAPGTAFEITCFKDDVDSCERHLRKFLQNTTLERILWANVVSGHLTLVVVEKTKRV